MKKIIILILATLVAVIIPYSMEDVYGDFAEVTDVSFTHDGSTININYIDPVKFVGVLNGEGYPVDAEIVINNKRARAGNVTMYTPDWYMTSTGLATKYELVVQMQDGDLVITQINENGDSYIPLDGFVLAFGSVPTETYDVGDVITLSGYDFAPAVRAVESETGYRVLIDAVNSTRSKPMVVYYSSNYGEKTGNNQWGVEITVNLDINTGVFSIGDFREIGEGTQQGIDIPYYGFVLSAYGDPYRLKLANSVLFNEGDELIVHGIPFVDLEATINTTFDYLNPTPEENPGGMEGDSPFPAVRGTDQLIVYTDSWDNTLYNGDGTGTGTNVWGYEIAVNSEGVIVEHGINVSVIPEGGFVLSGHGIGRDWLRSNALLGSQCTYDINTKTIELITTSDSYISVIKNNRDAAEGLILNAERKLFDINLDLAKSKLALLDAEIINLETISADLKTSPGEFSKLISFKQAIDISENLTNQIVYISYESRVVDSRGIWHRPNNAGYDELTLIGIENFLDDMSDNNINTIYVETFFHGYSISPNMETVTHHPWLSGGTYGEYGNDYLAAFIGEAHERGIEVHAWVQNFNVGFDQMVEAPFLTENPTWKLLNDDNTFFQRNEGGQYLFADPANPEVHEFLLNHYEELMNEYDFEGLHLDYIRYPVTYRSEDTGYTEYAINEFKLENDIANEVDFNELIKNDDDIYTKWIAYKTQNVTDFVENVVNLVDELDPDILISTAIFPDVAEATIKKNQDWPNWVKNGWIDITTPMAYYSGASTVQQKVKDMVLFVDGVTLNYGGIAPAFMGLEVFNNPLQIVAVREGEAFGSVIFASQNLAGYGEVSESLTLGIHSKSAILPHADISILIQAITNDLVGSNSKADRIYIPTSNMTELQKNNLKADLDTISSMNYSTSEEVQDIVDEINLLIENVKDYGSGFADNRIEDDLLYLKQILEVRITRLEIKEGIWVKPGTEPVPEPEPEPIECEENETLIDGECVIEDVPNEEGNNNKTIIYITTGTVALGVIGFIVKKFIF